MAVDPFLGQIQAFAFQFDPVGWHYCDGSLLSVAQYTALFSLINTTYGGNGSSDFGIPDLRGRVPLHMGQGTALTARPLGQKSGFEAHIITSAQLPTHTHPFTNASGGHYMVSGADGAVSAPDSTNNVVSAAHDPSLSYTNFAYNNLTPDVSVNTGSNYISQIQAVGGSQPIGNMEPFLVINYCIATEGIYPTRN